MSWQAALSVSAASFVGAYFCARTAGVREQGPPAAWSGAADILIGIGIGFLLGAPILALTQG